MGLVDYSDSDASDAEENASTKAPSKPAFQKVVDRSNPGKIRVTLPQAATSSTDRENGDEPPSKKVKVGGGGLSGFNSFLPPPKRTGAAANGSLGKGITKSGLAPGISLKTSAEVGFSREPVHVEEEHFEGEKSQTNGSAMNLPPPKANEEPVGRPADEVKLVGKPLMFKPLSVARKPAKKKKQFETTSQAPVSTESSKSEPLESSQSKAPQRPKVSLFSINPDVDAAIPSSASGEYEPMIYGANIAEDGVVVDPADDLSNFTPDTSFKAPSTAAAVPQSLDNIAADLNLSAAERRQLFGRQKGPKSGLPSATKVINFNTDEEYKHNEELRASGQALPPAKTVRAIAPGKHTLQQLVNQVQSQKDALEESFALGKGKRKEGGSRYGW